MEAREIALLLTDVESSTTLLVRQGPAGVEALERVADLISAAARLHGGRVSRTQGEGDSALMVFESAPAAVAAALGVNDLLAAEAWPGRERVRVRSAVHVGEVTEGRDGVFGLEVHRCARLRALADGGEVLLSSATVASVGTELPPNASLCDEGIVALKGFVEGERVWRLVHPRLEQRQRPLVAASLSAAALPVWRSSLVGRVPEREDIAARLKEGRLLTLVGPAGVGKTRLAAAVAADLTLRACFVDLTRATSDGEVPSITAQALGAESSRSPLEAVTAELLIAPALLVLDNCEHVHQACASLVELVLERCAECSVLATSRGPLRLPDEEVVAVEPLSTSPGGTAVELFLDRARAARPDLVVDDSVLGEIAAIVSLVDGVPLAIELAAARVNAFSVSELLVVLRNDLAGLADARRPGPPRHRTLRAAIEWSMGLVDEEERAVLCRLAVLPGSFRLITAVAVAEQDDGASVAFALPSLIEQSLLVREHGPGATRYRLLEMVRAVGQGLLAPTERERVLHRLLDFCLAEVAVIERHDLPDAGIRADIARDHALYAVAVDHALTTGQADRGLQLVHDLFLVWHGEAQRESIDRWMAALIDQSGAPSSARAMVLRRRALIAENQGDYERSMRLLVDAEADAIAVGDRQLLGRVWATRAGVDFDRGRLDGIEARMWEAVALLEEGGDDYAANSLSMLADVYILRAQFGRADELLRRAIAANPHWFVRVQIEINRAWCALMHGRIESATTHAATSLEMAETSGDPDLVGDAVEVAAYAALARGEVVLASELFERMVAFCREHDLAVSDALAGRAIVSALDGDLIVARPCRDEVRDRGEAFTATRAYQQLACAFVDLVGGEQDVAARHARDALAGADALGQRHARVLAIELLAACAASIDPDHARELLDTADAERAAIGAVAWALEPYRHAANAILDGRLRDR